MRGWIGSSWTWEEGSRPYLDSREAAQCVRECVCEGVSKRERACVCAGELEMRVSKKLDLFPCRRQKI